MDFHSFAVISCTYGSLRFGVTMMNKAAKVKILCGGGLASLVLASCGGGGGTPTPTFTAPIAQPSLPGTVVQILQSNGAGGYSALPVNSDGSYTVTDSTAIAVNAQTTQGLMQSISWGFSATDSSGLNYVALSTGGYQVSGSTDPILQNSGYSNLAAVPSSVANPTGAFPLQFSSLIAPGGSLVLGMGQGLTLGSAPFLTNTVFRVISAYSGNWSVAYTTAGTNPAYTGTCNINISNNGVVSGACSDGQLGSYNVTGRDFGSGNAVGVQFQGQNGVINFFMGASPVATNQLQGRTNMFVNTNSSTTSGTAGSNSISVTSIYAEDPFACQLIPGKAFTQIANPTVCSSTNTVLFGSTTGSSSTPPPPASGAASSGTSSSSSGQTGTGLPVTWTATKGP